MNKLAKLILTSVLALSLAACGANAAALSSSAESSGTESTAEVAEATSSPEAESAEESVEGIVIEHSMGTVTVPANPAKSVVFDLGILDTMDAIGVETELAVPVDSLTTRLEKYSGAVNAGGIKEPNLETLFEFEPDIIFISGRQADYYGELSEIAPTVYVDLNTETYMEDFARNVTNVGAIYSCQEQVAEKLSAIQAMVEEGREKAAQSDAKALILLTNDGSMSAYGRGSRFGIIHDVLGIPTVDGSIDVSTHGQEASYEYIAEMNPDLLFVVDRTAVVGGSQMASTTLDNDLIRSTKAAQNDKIVYLDAETWYLAGGGVTAVETMIGEALAALN